MVALFVVVAIAIVGVVAVLVARDRPLIEPDPVGGRPLDWPDRDGVSATTLSRVRFAVALRGYRMEQVDRVLEDTRAALAGRDARIAELQRVIGALRPDLAVADLAVADPVVADPVAADAPVVADPAVADAPAHAPADRPAEPEPTHPQELT